MGLGSLIIGVAIGAGGLFLLQKAEAEELPIIDLPPVVIFRELIDIVVDPIQIDSDKWQFEAEYFNRDIQSLRVEVNFEIFDTQNGKVLSQTKSLTIEPGASTKIFWDSGDLSTVSNLQGDFTAVFTADERGSFDPLSRPVTIIFPVFPPGAP